MITPLFAFVPFALVMGQSEPKPKGGDAVFTMGATRLPSAQVGMQDEPPAGLVPFEEPPKKGTKALFFCSGALRAVVLSPESVPFDCDDINSFYLLGASKLSARKVREVKPIASEPTQFVNASRWEMDAIVLRAYPAGLAIEEGSKRTWLVDFGRFVELDPQVESVPFAGDLNGDGKLDFIVSTGSATEIGGQRFLLLFVSSGSTYRLAAGNVFAWDGVLALPD